jgi:hemoglobin/transferrin/lactoferrin receptor protein
MHAKNKRLKNWDKLLKRSWYLCLPMLLCLSETYSQVVTVLDENSGLILQDVYIYVDQPLRQLKTNNNGQATIEEATQTSLFTFTHMGYDSILVSYSQLIENNFNVFMRPLSIGLEGVVVSASRWEQPKTETTERITVLSSRNRQFIQPQTTADWLASGGEVFVQKSQQGGGSPMIRGFSANRLMYTIDGVRMNNAIFRAGNLHNVISLDPYATERLEILFGPASVMYGSDAIGGVMSFHSLPLRFSSSDTIYTHYNIQGRFSSANSEKTGHVHLQLGSKKIAWTASLTRYEAEDLRMGSFGPGEFLRPDYVVQGISGDSIVTNPNPKVQTPSGYNQWNILQKLGIKINKYLAINYTYHGSFNPGFARYDRLIEKSALGKPISAVWEYGPQQWQMHLLSASYKKPNFWFDQARIQMANQRFTESRLDRPWAGSNQFLLRRQAEKVNGWNLQMDLQRMIGRTLIYYGAEWVFNKVMSEGSGTDIRTEQIVNVPDRYPASKWTSLGFYAKTYIPISKNVDWEGGLRYNNIQMIADFDRLLTFYPFPFNRAFQSNRGWTAGTGILWKSSPKLQFLGRLSTGFRAPNVDDLGKLFDYVAGEVVVPNTNLKPEYAYHCEIETTYGTKGIKIHAGSFFTWLDQAMVRRPFQVNGNDSMVFNGVLSRIFALQNASNTKVYGGHIRLDINPISGLNAHLICNLQRGTEEMADGTRSAARHAAPVFGQGGISYSKAAWQWTTQVFFSDKVAYNKLNAEERQKPALYARDNDGNPWSPSWYRIDIRAQYRIGAFSFIHIAIENITDQRYRTYSSGISAAGRNLVIAFQAAF